MSGPEGRSLVCKAAHCRLTVERLFALIIITVVESGEPGMARTTTIWRRSDLWDLWDLWNPTVAAKRDLAWRVCFDCLDEV